MAEVLFDDQKRESFESLLKWRRDVRHFKRDPLPPDVLESLRRVTDLCPSVGNARPWRFIEVDDPKLREEVQRNFAESNEAARQGYADSKQTEYAALKLAGLAEAPYQLAVFCETQPMEGHGLGRQTMPQTLEQSVVMAIHTLWLYARVMNIGLGMVSIVDPKKLTQALSVPETWRFVAYLCLGYPEAQDDTPLLHRSGWQEDTRAVWLKR